jgi:predicted DNA-binding transcriptional regulator AlpA
MIDEKLLDGKKTAEFLGCTEAALALWRKKRQGPSYVRLGMRLVRYPLRDLLTWLEKQRIEPEQPCIGRKEADSARQ